MRQKLEAAFAACAEAEIVADEQVAGVERLAQQPVDKRLGGHVGEALVETQNPDGVDTAGFAQQAQFGAQRADAVGQFFTGLAGEKFFGLRLENDDGDGQAAQVGFVFEFLQDVFVSEVYAVEVADGNGGALRKVGRVGLTETDFHG